jgi:putative hydrolase of the HAD superfamily
MLVMRRPATSHVLFDFFGTLVDYTDDGASAALVSAALVNSYGASVSVDEFATGWNENYRVFEARARLDHREFSMEDLGRTYLARVLRREPTKVEASDLASTYTKAWNDGVVYRGDTLQILDALADRFRLAVVSNTHEADLVPGHLAAMGIADRFDVVITSVEFGHRKPHPAIYAEALDRLGIEAAQAVFVGDTYDADFVGPEAAGIRAYLIDPAHSYDIPDDQRLASLADLPGRL